MLLYGYDTTGAWQSTTGGKTVSANKNGKAYILKKFQEPLMPTGSEDALTLLQAQMTFFDFTTKRRQLQADLARIAEPGGNILPPFEGFTDKRFYIEATECPSEVLVDEEVDCLLSGLPLAAKLLMMKTAIGALVTLHESGFVHGDIKPQSLLLAVNSAGNYITKLTDFGNTFQVTTLPDTLSASLTYCSPELGVYLTADGAARASLADKIGEKTDIFSMGLLFHYYLCGELPEVDMSAPHLPKGSDADKTVSPWMALHRGGELRLNAGITSWKYITLIADMLHKSPDKRPTAREVLARLQAPEMMMGELLLPEPFPGQNIAFCKDVLQREHVVAVEKRFEAAKPKYRLLHADGKQQLLTREELAAAGYIQDLLPDSFEEPLPEHGIRFDIARMRNRGFVSAKNAIRYCIRGYELYRADGSTVFMRAEMLLLLKYAKARRGAATVKPENVPVDGTSGFAAPWVGQDILFLPRVMLSNGYITSERACVDGVQGYHFTGTDGSVRFLKPETVLALKMAKRI